MMISRCCLEEVRRRCFFSTIKSTSKSDHLLYRRISNCSITTASRKSGRNKLLRRRRVPSYYCSQNLHRSDFYYSPRQAAAIKVLGCHYSSSLIKNKYHYHQTTRTLSTSTNTTTFSSTISQQQQQQQQQNHVPPLPIRIALVTSTTAICTPAFPAIGFLNIVLRFSLPDKDLRSIVSGSAGTILSFTAFTLVPSLYNIAPLLLPFAVGNGICAGLTYGFIDIISGGPTTTSSSSKNLLSNPLVTGGCLGAFTGFMAPYFFYGPTFTLLYGIDNFSTSSSTLTESIRMIMNFPMVSEICCTTGFVAGMSIYPLLAYPIYGVPGMHWINTSALLLLLSSLGLYYIYTPTDDGTFPLPVDGVYVDPKIIPLLDSIIRYDTETQKMYTYSTKTKQNVGPPELCIDGRIASDKVRKYYYDNGKQSVIIGGKQQQQPEVFDNQILAWLYYVLDKDIATRHPNHVVHVERDIKTIQEKQNDLLVTDGIVSFIMERDGSTTSNGDSGRDVDITSSATRTSSSNNNNNSKTYKTLTELLHQIDLLNGENKKNSKRKGRTTKDQQLQQKKEIMSIENVSIAVELLLILHRDSMTNNNKNMLNSSSNDAKLMNDLEKTIRKKYPGIIIFEHEEEEVEGKNTTNNESVESQLRKLSWNGGNLQASLSKWEHITKQETRQNILKKAVQGFLAVSIGGLVLLMVNK